MISIEKFMEIWNRSDSPGEAAREMGISKEYATHRACISRRKGLKIKKMKSGRPSITKEDIEVLNNKYGVEDENL